MRRLHSLALAVVALAVLPGPAVGAAAGSSSGRVGPATGLTPLGRLLDPVGRLTAVGDFPTGGALTPDGRFYWAIDSGHGQDAADVVDVASGELIQRLPLPGAYGAVAFAPNGRTAYVSGEPRGSTKPLGPTKGDGGDVIHVFAVDPASGKATEGDPIALPATSGGQAQQHAGNPANALIAFPGPGPSSGNGWPEGLAVTPDGHTLAVALGQADKLAIVDLASRTTRLVDVGSYPDDVAISHDGRTAFVTCEGAGTLDAVDLAGASRTASIDVGGANAHPEGIVVDPHRPRAYVAVANRDTIAEVDTASATRTGTVALARDAGPGAQPVDVALSPDGSTLYAADAGEDAVAVVAVGRRTRRGPKPGTVEGRIPTAEYPSGVAVTPDGSRLVWLAAEGLGAGPNPGYGTPFANSGAAPYGTYVLDMLVGRVGVMPVPSEAALRRLTGRADAEVHPRNPQQPPPGTPIRPNGPIKHVFYVVKENRTYDQLFGSDPRGDGDPSLELFDDNGASGPAAGVTPNAHALTRRFPLLDHFYSDSQVSVDGHIITTSAYAIDYVERALHANYSGRGRVSEFGSYPITLPPRYSLFDSAAAAGVPFQVLGESAQGSDPAANDGRSTYPAVRAGTNQAYPPIFGCQTQPNGVTDALLCDRDSGTLGPTGALDAEHSRFDTFQAYFDADLAAGQVPALTYLTLPNDHTNGVHAGYPTPRAEVADNDLGLGQVVDKISHSPIWSSSAIFVVEDDSQDGADHVDAHRAVSYVISPWTTTGQADSSRYDQESVLRTIEILLGLEPLSLFDGMATPMYAAFRTGQSPDLRPYSAIQPQVSLDEKTPAGAATAFDAALPADKLDAVPEELLDAALYRSVYGRSARPRPPGPNASPAERARAWAAVAAWRHGGARAVRRALGGKRDRDG
jgi:DNA-binding beta-propeller fold protein YncE